MTRLSSCDQVDSVALPRQGAVVLISGHRSTSTRIHISTCIVFLSRGILPDCVTDTASNSACEYGLGRRGLGRRADRARGCSIRSAARIPVRRTNSERTLMFLRCILTMCWRGPMHTQPWEASVRQHHMWRHSRAQFKPRSQLLNARARLTWWNENERRIGKLKQGTGRRPRYALPD